MGRSPSGKEQGVDDQGGSHCLSIVANRRPPVKDTPASRPTGPSTLGAVGTNLRRLRRTVLAVAVTATVVAVGRAALGRLAGDPGTSGGRGSFDAWPAVTPAPGRRAEDGTAPGTMAGGDGAPAAPR